MMMNNIQKRNNTFSKINSDTDRNNNNPNSFNYMNNNGIPMNHINNNMKKIIDFKETIEITI
jgi:hypothetical protein